MSEHVIHKRGEIAAGHSALMTALQDVFAKVRRQMEVYSISHMISALRMLVVQAFMAFVLLQVASAQDKITFGTNWKAQPEHGGFYQALADGTYKEFGLDVEIRPGGPQVNNRALLSAGTIEFYMGGNFILPFSAVEQGIPTVVVAALFQKDPQVLIAHDRSEYDSFDSLKSAPAFISRSGEQTFYRWLVSARGFSPERMKPYNFNPAPFLADPKSIMQGYITSEPYSIERASGMKPKVFLLADFGFDTYSTTIETTEAFIERHPDIVQRFVDASIIGWYNFLYGDHSVAKALIQHDNPQITDDAFNYAVQAMRDAGIVDSGDALILGIGAMTEERIASFYEAMVKAGVSKAELDWKKSFTLEFINRKVGMNLRP